jgi:hypothetical protein
MFVVNRSFLQQVVAGEPFDLERYFARQEPGGSGGLALGLRAIRDGHGFRNDGSEQYGDFLVANWLYAPNVRERDLGWAREGRDMYLHGDVVWELAMERMAWVLDWAEAHDVQVIGFLPPYMPTLWAEYGNHALNGYVPATRERLETLFATHNYPLLDFSDGAVLGATDEDFFDGWHASERATLQMVIDMVRQVPALADYADADTLQSIHDVATDTFRVFPFVGE